VADVFLGIGANEGDREGNIKMALDLLRNSEDIRIIAVSSLYRTKVLGGSTQPDFLNCVVRISTELDPHSLLKAAKSIEEILGRQPGTHMQPRPMDIDILLYDNLEIQSEDLRIPHSRLTQRRFVLEPLLEIAPEAVDPASSTPLADFVKKTLSQDVTRIREDGRSEMPDSHSYKPDPGKITTRTFRRLKAEGTKIAVLTAYDFPTARILDEAGIDCIMVGDSAGTVVAGHPTTLPITMDQMIFLTQAVARGGKRALVVGDMPFMSFQTSEGEAIHNAGRFLKEGGAQAVKLEGGSEIAPLILKMVDFGIPVMGHIGLTPQSINKFGAHLIMGKTEKQKKCLLQSAQALQDAGCFAIVLESVLPDVAKEITAAVRVPTIGIGAGPNCDGQVLVISDMIGLFEEFRPKFVRVYADVAGVIRKAAKEYIEDVRNSRFPGEEETYG